MLASIARVQVIAANVFREVIRDRVLYLLGFYAVGMILVQRLLPEIAASTEEKMLPDVGLAAMQVLGLVLAIFVGTGLVNREIEKRTVFVLIAKPVSPAEVVVGKHLGLSGVLAVLLAVMTAIYAGVMTLGRVPLDWVGVGLCVGFLWLQLSLVTAIAIGFGVFTSSLLATLMTFAVYLMGSLSRDLVTFGKLAKNPTIEQVTRGMYLLLPDLSRLDLKNQLVYHLIPAQDVLLANAGYGLLYIVLVLAIASFLFSTREF